MQDYNNESIDVSGADGRSFGPFPAGTYECVIHDAHIDDTKKGDGRMLVVVLDVDVDGSQRKHWDRFLFRHPSERAVEVGKARMRELADAAGINPQDVRASYLVGKRVNAKFGVKDDANVVWGYFNPELVPLTSAGAPVTPPPPEPQAKPLDQPDDTLPF